MAFSTGPGLLAGLVGKIEGRKYDLGFHVDNPCYQCSHWWQPNAMKPSILAHNWGLIWNFVPQALSANPSTAKPQNLYFPNGSLNCLNSSRFQLYVCWLFGLGLRVFNPRHPIATPHTKQLAKFHGPRKF